jgi:DNA-binding response OmpR family regulator
MPQVMIVNGDPVLGTLWQNLFEERGYDVQLTGSDINDVDCQAQVDLVVLDVDTLPSVGQGLLLIERMRAASAEVPIVAISDWALSSMREEAHDLGATVCVRKPVNYVVFLKLVDAMMHRMGAASQVG